MLGRHDHILRACFFKKLRPGRRIIPGGGKAPALLHIIFIGNIPIMKGPGFRYIPHRINAIVYKNPKPGLSEPFLHHKIPLRFQTPKIPCRQMARRQGFICSTVYKASFQLTAVLAVLCRHAYAACAGTAFIPLLFQYRGHPSSLPVPAHTGRQHSSATVRHRQYPFRRK